MDGENDFRKLTVNYLLLHTVEPGQVLDENLTVGCRSNSVQILELQRQGKNRQTTKEFLLGKKISRGSILD